MSPDAWPRWSRLGWGPSTSYRQAMSESARVAVRFVDELPPCLQTPLRLPRPHLLRHRISGEDDGAGWDLGLNVWALTVGVSWVDGAEDLVEALTAHLGEAPETLEETLDNLALHGIVFDAEEVAWVGAADLAVAALRSTLAAAAGRNPLEEGSDLLDAVDAESGDLEHLVGAVVSVSDDDQIWSEEILDRWPEATEAAVAILVRTVHITPVMRGHRLGAWAAAQSIAHFDQTGPWWLFRPPPLRGVTSGSCALTDDAEFTERETAKWRSEQRRLADHWQSHLGLTPLATNPNVLVWSIAFETRQSRALCGSGRASARPPSVRGPQTSNGARGTLAASTVGLRHQCRGVHGWLGGEDSSRKCSGRSPRLNATGNAVNRPRRSRPCG